VLQSWTVDQFGDAERLALRRCLAALLGVPPARVALTVEAASVRATAVVSAPDRTMATSYAGVLAALTPESLSAAIGAYYTGTSSLTVDASEAPIVLPATQQAPPPPMPPMVPMPAPPRPDVLLLGLLTVVVLGAVLLFCLCRRRRLREQRRSTAEKEHRAAEKEQRAAEKEQRAAEKEHRAAEKEQRAAEKEQHAEKEMMSAVLVQARARSLIAKRTLHQARSSKEVREEAATRMQASVRKRLKLRKMQRELAAMLEAERLDQLQREARASALSHAVRRRHALSTMTEFLERRALKASMKVNATMIVQDYARRWFSARESHADSIYRRARAHWLRMSRFIRRRHHVAIQWRAMVDAVLETARGGVLNVATSDRPLLEAVQALWQVVWRWIGSPPALQLAPQTPSRLAKHRLLCQLRLALLCDRLRPREPTVASIALQQLRALSKPTRRVPRRRGAFRRSNDSSPDVRSVSSGSSGRPNTDVRSVSSGSSGRSNMDVRSRARNLRSRLGRPDEPDEPDHLPSRLERVPATDLPSPVYFTPSAPETAPRLHSFAGMSPVYEYFTPSAPEASTRLHSCSSSSCSSAELSRRAAALTTVRSPAALSPPPRRSSVEGETNLTNLTNLTNPSICRSSVEGGIPRLPDEAGNHPNEAGNHPNEGGIPRLRMSSINRVAGSARRAAPPLHTNLSSHHRRAAPPLINGTLPEAQRLPPPERWVRQPTSSPVRQQPTGSRVRQPTGSRVRQPTGSPVRQQTSSRSNSGRALTDAISSVHTSSVAPMGAGVGIRTTPSVPSGALTLPPDASARILSSARQISSRTISSARLNGRPDMMSFEQTTRQRGAAHTEGLTTGRTSVRRGQGSATGAVHV
jgi:hypothetical protein